jgi:hypothetical protein
VRAQVEDIGLLNRDPHLLFNQVGQRTGLIPGNTGEGRLQYPPGANEYNAFIARAMA